MIYSSNWQGLQGMQIRFKTILLDIQIWGNEQKFYWKCFSNNKLLVTQNSCVMNTKHKFYFESSVQTWLVESTSQHVPWSDDMATR